MNSEECGVQGPLKRKTVIKDGRRPAVAAWHRYWVSQSNHDNILLSFFFQLNFHIPVLPVMLGYHIGMGARILGLSNAFFGQKNICTLTSKIFLMDGGIIHLRIWQLRHENVGCIHQPCKEALFLCLNPWELWTLWTFSPFHSLNVLFHDYRCSYGEDVLYTTTPRAWHHGGRSVEISKHLRANCSNWLGWRGGWCWWGPTMYSPSLMCFRLGCTPW